VSDAPLVVLGLQYAHNRIGEADTARVDAVAAVAAGGRGLIDRYIGCKNYDRWVCQRSDHPYGMGPAHGHVVFAVELAADVRARLKQDDANVLDPDEIRLGLAQLGIDSGHLRAVVHRLTGALATLTVQAHRELDEFIAGQTEAMVSMRAARLTASRIEQWRQALELYPEPEQKRTLVLDPPEEVGL